MLEIWTSSDVSGLWELNCLFYAGAKIVEPEVDQSSDDAPLLKSTMGSVADDPGE